jgi:hypothetical protein
MISAGVDDNACPCPTSCKLDEIGISQVLRKTLQGGNYPPLGHLREMVREVDSFMAARALVHGAFVQAGLTCGEGETKCSEKGAQVSGRAYRQQCAAEIRFAVRRVVTTRN